MPIQKLLLVIVMPYCVLAQSKLDSLYRNLSQQEVLRPNDEAKTLSQKGTYYYNHGQFDSALYYHRMACRINSSEKNNDELAINYNDMGTAFYQLGAWDSAVYYYKKARTQFKETNRDYLASTEINLGILYKDRGLYDQALDYCLAAVRRLESNEPTQGLASCYSTIANIYSKIDDYDEALAYQYKALGVRKRIGHIKGIGKSYTNLGNTYSQLKQYDSALACYNKALDIKRSLDDPSQVAVVLHSLGDVWLLQQQPDIALPYLTESLTLKRKHADLAGEMASLNSLGRLYLMKNNYAKALGYLITAEAIGKELGSLSAARDNFELLLTAYEHTGQSGKALYYSKKLAIISDSIMNVKKAEILVDIQTRYETEKKEQQIILLQQEKELQAADIENKRIWIEALVVIMSLVIVIGLLFYRQSILIKRNEKKVHTLLKELHHRVKNNLQILSSVLSLQSQHLTDEVAIQAVKGSEGRVNAMALIHKKLYRQDETREINIKEYITELVEYLVYIYGYTQRDLKLDVIVQEIQVDVDKAIPIGLIINELVSNAFKYAFNDQLSPELAVQLRKKDEQLLVEVRDNGLGVMIDLDSVSSFGLKMVRLLLRELKGTFDVKTQRGTSFILTIPIS